MWVAVVGVVILAAGGWWFSNLRPNSEELVEPVHPELSANELVATSSTDITRLVVTPGSYIVSTTTSHLYFAGKKPLIDGYVDSGIIDLLDGMITVGDATATGAFTIDMNSLDVTLTAKKPGQESILTEHLKGSNWFDVAAYPTASFTIATVVPQADSSSTFTYNVTGNLTMKGKTKEISFPATIYQNLDGSIAVEATTTIDRTMWGLKFMSGTFFDNLANNVIADEVQLEVALVATLK